MPCQQIFRGPDEQPEFVKKLLSDPNSLIAGCLKDLKASKKIRRKKPKKPKGIRVKNRLISNTDLRKDSTKDPTDPFGGDMSGIFNDGDEDQS